MQVSVNRKSFFFFRKSSLSSFKSNFFPEKLKVLPTLGEKIVSLEALNVPSESLKKIQTWKPWRKALSEEDKNGFWRSPLLDFRR